LNSERLLANFLELLKIDSPSGSEDAIAGYLMGKLRALGFRTERDARGNVMGWVDQPGEPILLNAHMDNVSPCLGVKPQVANGMVRSDGTTVLGADDKAGIAVILEALESTAGQRTRCPEVLFTVEEEKGLHGSKAVDASRFRSKWALVLDSGDPPGAISIQGPGQNSFSVAVIGRAAHAGAKPENGLNAIVVASKAIAEMKVGRIDFETTANVGVIHGGAARNIVPERVEIIAEARSRDEAKLEAQTKHMVDCFEKAVQAAGAKLELNIEHEYDSFKVAEDHPLVLMLKDAAHRAGLEPKTMFAGGGTDGHHLCRKGIVAVALGMGTQDAHSTNESASLTAIEGATRWVETILRG
jgi:tripeptide aminopeptidase